MNEKRKQEKSLNISEYARLFEYFFLFLEVILIISFTHLNIGIQGEKMVEKETDHAFGNREW